MDGHGPSESPSVFSTFRPTCHMCPGGPWHYLQRFRTSRAVRFLLSIDFKLEETCTETPAGLAELQELLMQQVKVCVWGGGSKS